MTAAAHTDLQAARTALVDILYRRAFLLSVPLAPLRERRHASDQRKVERTRQLDWITPKDALYDAGEGNPHDLETALKSGLVRARFQHVGPHDGRWWQSKDVPDEIWKAVHNGARLIGADGASHVDNEHWALRIHRGDWREYLGKPNLEAAAPVPADVPPILTDTTVEPSTHAPETEVRKESNAGAPALHDWGEAVRYAGELWSELGDPRNPLDAKDGYRSDIDLARRVADHLKVFDPDQEAPDPRYVADRLRPEIKKLRASR